MAGNDLKSLVDRFAAELEAIVERRANEAFGAKFDSVKAQLVGSTAAKTAPIPTNRGPGRPKGSRSLGPAAEKPCPVCGKPNVARRFSYLCDDHRSAENLAKFKGGAKAKPAMLAAKIKRGPGRPKKTVVAAVTTPEPVAAAVAVPAVKRGPGRPKKVVAPVTAPVVAAAPIVAVPPVKRRPGRPAKAK